jgi:protein associated with RNAse G/E
VGFIAIVPANEWWLAEFYRDHPRYDVYVNIGTPPQWHGDRIHQIDLDLDVVRYTDGSVAVLDEDEFAHHRVESEYPDDLVAAALEASERAVGLLEPRAEPFGVAAVAWLEQAGHA